ncbi:MAG: hypothetical protein ACAH88_03270, partial [Roseimicrobium sp.]
MSWPASQSGASHTHSKALRARWQTADEFGVEVQVYLTRRFVIELDDEDEHTRDTRVERQSQRVEHGTRVFE